LSEKRVTITINVPLASVVALMLLVHFITLIFHLDWLPDLNKVAENEKRTFNVREIRTVGAKDSKIKDKILVTKDHAEKAKQDPFATAADMNQPLSATKPAQKVTKKQAKKDVPVKQKNPYRPEAPATALEQLSMRAEPVKNVASRTDGGGAQLGGSPTLSKSLMNMQVEMPEGVNPDELNKFELMFYGFQKRMMEKYFSSIVLNVRDYEKRYSMKVLIPEGKHSMTGRVTFDSEGNIKQIKMVKWTQAEKLQNMFEDILKSMHTLPNPPKMLRNSDGEFVVFYSFIIDNG
jgi:hypothetical protein